MGSRPGRPPSRDCSLDHVCNCAACSHCMPVCQQWLLERENQRFNGTAVWLQPESTPLFGKLLAVESAFDSLIINDVTR